MLRDLLPTRWRWAGVLAPVAALALLAAGVLLGVRPGSSSEAAPEASTAPTSTVAATTAVPSTAVSGPVPTTIPVCVPLPSLTAPGTEAVPSDLAAVVAARVADARFADVAVSISVWIDGYGEVVAHNAGVPLLPASNQKLLTALGAMALLPPDGTFTTTVRTAGIVGDAVLHGDGVLHGDLVLVGGGDPTLTRSGAHSLDALAAQVRDAGIRHVNGSVMADESRQELARAAAGWQDWQIPTYAGPLSALVVDDNRHRTDPAYLGDPAVGNAEAFVAALARNGVTVSGPAVGGVAPPASTTIAVLESAPFVALVDEMLLRSDNEIAEMLVREVGVRVARNGSTAAGLDAMTRAIEEALCLELDGVSGDGSGLSRADFRSAREWRTIVQAAMTTPWWPEIDAALPVAARTGTLANRFHRTAAAGNLRAKTGSIIGGRALTGHLRTAGGREVVFSMVVNGERSGDALGAMDDLVVALAADDS